MKQRIYPMLGFKRFRNALVTISGIELAQKIRKGQFNIASLRKGELPFGRKDSQRPASSQRSAASSIAVADSNISTSLQSRMKACRVSSSVGKVMWSKRRM